MLVLILCSLTAEQYTNINTLSAAQYALCVVWNTSFILTCQSRKHTGINSNINNGLTKCNKPCQRERKHVTTRELEPVKINGMEPVLIINALSALTSKTVRHAEGPYTIAVSRFHREANPESVLCSQPKSSYSELEGIKDTSFRSLEVQNCPMADILSGSYYILSC